jgi:hypothetical protein
MPGWAGLRTPPVERLTAGSQPRGGPRPPFGAVRRPKGPPHSIERHSVLDAANSVAPCTAYGAATDCWPVPLTKRFMAPVRLTSVMKLTPGMHQYVAGWGAIALACAYSPRSAMLALVVAAAATSAWLLAEWQRRSTLVAIVERARPGTVVVQDSGLGGPAMRIEIGREARAPFRSREA